MRPFILLMGLFIALFTNLSVAQNCISYATSVALKDATVVNPNNSLGSPNTTVADLPDDNDYIVWNMGTILPVGTSICVRVKKPSSGGNYDFKIWAGADSLNFTQVGSTFSDQSNSTLEDKCVTLTTTAKYIKLTHEDNSDMSVDAVIATIPKPNAGNHQTVCVNSVVNLSAAASTGSWSVRTSPANPSNTSFGAANNANSTVNGLTAVGTYGFIWTVGGCKDTVLITTTAKPNAGADKTATDLYSNVTMSATAVTGGIWTEAGSNPGLSVISNDNSATTSIVAFNKTGTYKYIWTANGCSDTAFVTVGGCDCADNKIINPSFESGSSTPSSWITGGSFTTWQKNSFAAQCGSGNSAQMDGNSNSSLAVFYQDVTITGGAQLSLKFKAGTHTPAQTAMFGLVFYNNNTRLDSFFLEVDHTLNEGTMLGYSINRTAPSAANKVRVIGKVGSDWLKVDLVCLNVSGGCSGTAGTDGDTLVCKSSTSIIYLANLIDGESTGGVWSRVSGSNGNFNAGAGTFVPASNATTSSFRYVITGTGGCPNDTSFANVTLTTPPNAGNNGDTIVCNTSTNAIILASLIDGETSGGTWSKVSGSNGNFNAAAGTFTPASNATTSTFRYVLSGTGGCPTDTSIATVTITACCNGRITSLFFNKLSGSPDIAITNGGNYPLTTLSNLYNLEASVSGTLESVKFIITGPSASTPTDNSSVYNAPATGTAWVPTAGNYSVKIEAYSNDNAGGTKCHDTTITFTITNITCTPEAGMDGSMNSCPINTSIDLFSIISAEVAGGAWSRVSGSGASYTNGSSTFNPNGATSNYVFRYVKTGISPCPNDTSLATVNIITNCGTTTVCFVGTNNNTVTAKMITTIMGDKVKIWTQLSKTFVDNTYGTTAIGWNNHNFKMLYQSDQIQLTLYDNNNSKKLEFKMDYLSADASVSSGYKSLGVTGGDGGMMTGNASSVISVYTSMDKNFNELGYVLTENSPATDENYTPNPTYPNWIFDVWYEVVVDAAVFGASGFKNAALTGMHASPSKTGVESEPVDEGPCCTAQITGLLFKHLSGGANIPIVEGGTYNLSSFNDLYDLEASTSGTVGSVKFTVGLTGQNGTSNTENSSPYNANWDPQTAGSYTVNVQVFSGSNLTGTICDEYNFVFIVATLGSIGDYVWLDANGNGQQESSEHQLKGIIVTLTKPDNSTVKDTTDNDGKYLFTGLVAGTYSLSFGVPGGYTTTASNSGNDNTDSDINASGIVSGIVLTSGQSNLTIDAGLKVTNCDCPENSTNLISNPGFEDALVSGYWTVSGGSLTTGDGYQMCGSKNAFLDHSSGTARMFREFSNVNAGSVVNLNIYAGTHTPGQSCSPWLKLIYLNASGVSLKRDSVDLDKDVDVPDYLLKYFSLSGVAPSGTTKIRVEITITCDYVKLDGFCLTASPTSSLGNFVWNDLNGDGDQDAGEPGLSGVSVTLTNVTTSFTTPATTDINGKYLFTGLTPGTYKVTFGTPSGFTASTSNSGTDDKDSDPVGGVTSNYILAAGQVDTTVDAGFYKTASLGNFVWNDLNADGDQDAGEPGISGVSVTLTNVNTAGTTSATTDGNGKYLFTGLTPGLYNVRFGTPSGFTPSTANSGADDKDSDPVAGVTANYVLISGQVDSTVDAGFYATASLGNFVWNDLNGDGDQDAGEPGISGVSVTLTNVTTSATTPSTTNSSGRYLFTGLTPGTYKVTFGTPSGFLATTSNVGADDKDSDASGGMSGNYILISGQVDSTVDAGFYKTASLGNFVWHDLNADGDQDASEPGISGASVTLTNVTTSVTTPGATNANGRYFFNGLTPGTYKVTFATPSGFVPSPANAGADDKDSDANGAGMTGNYVLTSGQSDTTVDAGFYKTASLGNFVWDDIDLDGIQDPGEPGIPGSIFAATVILTNITTGVSSSPLQTDIDGKYLFSGLTPGTYKVTFSTPTGYIPTTANNGIDTLDSDADFTTGMTGNYTLTSGQVDLTVDAGFRIPAAPIMPDLQPTISILPSSFTVNATSGYSRLLRVIVRINEVEDVPTTGHPIIVRIPKTSKLSFTYSPSLTSLGATILQNSSWSFSNADPIYWVFTYTGGVFPAYGESKFGFTATFFSEGETGQMFFNSIIVQGSGGETNFLNNVDDERIDYITN